MRVLPLSVVVFGVLLAAGTDVWKFRIHNALTVPLFISGLMFHALLEGTLGLSVSVWGVLAGTLPFLVVYAKGGLGAGDLKLLAGVGAWLGPWFALHVLIVSGLATGCYSAGLMIGKRARSATEPRRTNPPKDVIAVLQRSDRRANAVPFGAMIALGVIVTTMWIG